MASSYLLSPLGSSQLIFPSSFSEKIRATSSIALQRRSEQCAAPAFAFHGRHDHRFTPPLSTRLSASSSSRPDTQILVRDNLSQTVDVDPRAAAASSQLHGSERHAESFQTSREPSGMLGASEQMPPVSGTVVASSEQLNTGSYFAESMNGVSRPDPGSNPYEKSMADTQNQWYSPQSDATNKVKYMGAPPSSQFYLPKSGDLVLGVVTHSNDLEFTVEIGSKVPAMITSREFQTIIEVGTDSFLKLPLDDDSEENVESFAVPPVGNVLLVEDQSAYAGAQSGENIKIGTVFVGEVLNSALGESRPLLTCRRLAERLVFLRIEQIMKTGEPIKIEIMQYNDGGLQGKLEGLRVFLPKSELLARPENTAALKDYVGKTLMVSITKLEHQLSNVIVSEIKPWMSENVILGSVHDLLVTKLFPYGLQVEILDTRVRGFIHIKSITRGFAMSVYTFFEEGDVIRGMVIKGRKPGQLSFSIAALEPPGEDGLVLKQRERVYDGAEEVAKISPEYQLPMEERRIFAKPSSSTSVSFQDKIANLPWLCLEKLRNPS